MERPVEPEHHSAPTADSLAAHEHCTYAAPAPHSRVRAPLAAAIHELAIAAAELNAAQQPAARFGDVIAKAARLEAEIASLRTADTARLGAWLAAGAAAPRPQPCPAMIAAEPRLEALAAEAVAARAALPAAEQAFQHCAERVRALQARRDAAIGEAAIEAARHYAKAYRAALTAALEREAVLHGLRNELLSRGNRPNGAPGATNAAARIGDLIAETKRSAAVRHNPQAGQRLLAALVSDADATL